MSMKEFAKLDDEQLQKRDAELRRDLFNLRAQMNTGSLKKFSELKSTRRDIARVQTLQRQRQMTK